MMNPQICKKNTNGQIVKWGGMHILFYCVLIGFTAAAIQVLRFSYGYRDVFVVANNFLTRVAHRIPAIGGILVKAGNYGLYAGFLHGWLVFLLLYFLIMAFLSPRYTLADRLYRNRYYAAIAVIVLCAVANLNNTSLFEWRLFFEPDFSVQPLLGLPREIRSDEWATWSAFTIAQGKTGFRALSPVMEGGGIDVAWVSVGGLPAFNWAAIFKPMYWGFLLLGTERGYSLLWTMRCMLLMLVSFELAMRVTKGNRLLSLTTAFLTLFAPYVQWWFSQSIAEILIFSMLMALGAYEYADTQSIRKRWLLSGGMAYSLGCLIMIGYPGWIISFLYLTVPIMVFCLARRRDNLHTRDIIRLAVPLCAVLACLLIIVSQSWDTLQSVKNSAYPGVRLYTGGRDLRNSLGRLLGGLSSSMFQFTQPVFKNPCELANFVSFAPAGIILAIGGMIKRRKIHPLQTVIIGVEAALFFFEAFGIPAALAKITLLSQCIRNSAVLGFADVFLLISALSCKQKYHTLTSVLLTAVSVGVNYAASGLYGLANPYLVAIPTLLYLPVFFVIYTSSADDFYSMRRLCIVVCMTMLFTTGFVNPIQSGVEDVVNLELVQALNQSEDDADALYLIEASWPASNIPLLAGKRTFNSTSVYANLRKWKQLDPEGIYEDTYNRMAHCSAVLTTEEKPSFNLTWADSLCVYIPFSMLRELQIDYIISKNDYSDFLFEGCRMIPTASGNGYTVYRVEYAS